MSAQELTDEQVDRVSFIIDTVQAMLTELAGQEIEHDELLDVTMCIADTATEFICDKLKLMDEMECFPYVESGSSDTSPTELVITRNSLSEGQSYAPATTQRAAPAKARAINLRWSG